MLEIFTVIILFALLIDFITTTRHPKKDKNKKF